MNKFFLLIFLFLFGCLNDYNRPYVMQRVDQDIILAENKKNNDRYELEKLRIEERQKKYKEISKYENNNVENITEIERRNQIRLKEEIENPELARVRRYEEEKKKEKELARKERLKRHKKELEANMLIEASSGSGFIVSNNGHIVTNHHVINGCSNLNIISEGKTYPASILHIDKINDLALIKANFSPSMVFSINNTDAELIQDIYVAGYPFGKRVSSTLKVTKGIVSSLSGVANNTSHIQIDAALQSGNSGGPIVDHNGNIIGVAVAKLDWAYMVEKFGQLPEDTNFAIKSSVLISFLNSIGINYSNSIDKAISKRELANKLNKATILISCFMTYAQIEQFKQEKVIFEEYK